MEVRQQRGTARAARPERGSGSLTRTRLQWTFRGVLGAIVPPLAPSAPVQYDGGATFTSLQQQRMEALEAEVKAEMAEELERFALPETEMEERMKDL